MIQAIIYSGEHPSANAATPLLGLPVAERIVRNLRSRGVDEIHWWGNDTEMPAVEGAALRPLSAEQLRQLLHSTRDDLALIPSHVVYHPDTVPRLLRRAMASNTPQAAGPTLQEAVLVVPARQAAQLSLPENPVLTPEALARSAGAELWNDPEAPFVIPLSGAAERHRAQRALLALNWRPHDGIIARLVNKHISVRISALLANTSITPNQMTTVAFVIALLGIALTAKGTYLAVLIGASLIQLQSILDGCDGELARLRYQSSDWGGWYDTVVDDLIGALWLGTLGLGTARASGNNLWLLLGLAAGTASVLTASYVYTVLLRHGGKGHHEFTWWFEEGRPRAAGYPDPRELSTWAKYVVRRDFYVFLFFLLALLGQLSVITTLAIAGAAANFGVTAVQFAKRGMKLTRA